MVDAIHVMHSSEGIAHVKFARASVVSLGLAWLGTVASGGVGKVAAEICGEVLTSSKFCWCEE